MSWAWPMTWEPGGRKAGELEFQLSVRTPAIYAQICRRQRRFRLIVFWESYSYPPLSFSAARCASWGRRTVRTEKAHANFQRFWNRLQLEWGDERERTVSRRLIQCPWPCQTCVMDRWGLTCIDRDRSNWSWRYVSRHSWDILWTTERRTVHTQQHCSSHGCSCLIFGSNKVVGYQRSHGHASVDGVEINGPCG